MARITPYLTLPQLRREVKYYIDEHYTTTLSATAPILSRYIRLANNLEVTGTFSTNDDTVEGRPFYVTTLRQADRYAVQDGYGFVVIRGNSQSSREMYNVFLVDHNILLNEISFGNFLQVPNINSFIQGGEGVLTAGKAIVEKNVSYNFRLKILDNWSMDVRIWKDGEDYTNEGGWATMPDGPLYSGALTDGPLSYGGQQIQSPITGQFTNTTRGTDLGFAVDNPSGYKWYISNVQIRKFSGGVPIQLFEFSNKNTLKGNVQVNYYGYAEYTKNGTVYKEPVDVFIALVDDPNAEPEVQEFDDWYPLGTTAMVGANYSRLRITTPETAKYYAIADKFYIAITKDFESIGGVDLNTASIKTDYIEVSRAENLPVVDRSAVDIWVDPINILQRATSGVITLDSQVGGYTEVADAITYPLFLIERIYNSDTNEDYFASGAITINTSDLTGLMYSTRDNLILSHDVGLGGTSVKIDYWNCGTYGVALDSFSKNSKFRLPSQDVLVRIVPPTVLKINSLSYAGNKTVTEIKQVISNYVNSLGGSGILRKSDILSLLYSSGVSRIVVGTLDFQIIQYDFINGLYDTISLTDEFERPSTPGRWYTNNFYLSGVTKL